MLFLLFHVILIYLGQIVLLLLYTSLQAIVILIFIFYSSWHGAARKAAPPLQHVNCHPLFPLVCDVVTCGETRMCTFEKDARVTWRWACRRWRITRGSVYECRSAASSSSALRGCVPSDLKASQC